MITTPEEYMNRLANIQNQGGVSVVTIDPQNEPHFIIDADTRVITVPSAFTFLALKGDHNAETIYFEIDRYFDDHLDCDAFDTMPVALSDTLNAPITLSTMHWHSGTTDAVIGHHDGSPGSNTDSKHPYRVQGIEYAVGGYEVLSDVVLAFDDSNGKDVYVCPAGVAHTKTDAEILANYKKAGSFPADDFWIGDIGFDPETCVTYPATQGSGDKTGVGDRVYGGGNASKNTLREYLQGGNLGGGSGAGASFVGCGGGLGGGGWGCLAAD